jgi:UDP-galactopyranose mutase
MARHTHDPQETRTDRPAARTEAPRQRVLSPAVLTPGSAPVTFPEATNHRPADLVCLSHLRWDLVFQRPHHLLTRAARERRVYFVEEPLFGARELGYEIQSRQNGVHRVLFHLPGDLDDASTIEAQRQLVDVLVAEERIAAPLLWYYTPMALSFTRHLRSTAIVYDCMDELSAFSGAPPTLRAREQELMARADLVFTGGQSLYEFKRGQHPRVHAFPSSVDVAHFARARAPQAGPADQAALPRPRIGFFGVLDERFDIELVRGVAEARPDWTFVFLGPVVKIPVSALPSAPNLHYLGPKTYDDLPKYLSGWDVAILPFARNEATRYISPTKTPEYLAAGRPVVSTSIRDVVRPYGEKGLTRIADTVPEFVAAIEAALAEDGAARRARADAFLSQMSWDSTWARMSQLVDGAVGVKRVADASHALPGSAASAPPPA